MSETRIVPAAWMPSVSGSWRVITHWTAGAHEASELDREHYHFLLEGDGKLVRGEDPISANASTADGVYAAHTKGANTRSIGVAVCCMAGAMEQPFKPGRFPLTQAQWDAMVLTVADLCERYHIPVHPSRVLGHGEVSGILGIPQRGKWDPLKLPWAPEKSKAAVGNLFRSQVQDALNRKQAAPLEAAPVRVELRGQELSDEAILDGNRTFIPLRPLEEKLPGFWIADIDPAYAKISYQGAMGTVAAQIRGGRGYAKVSDLAQVLKWPAPAWDGKERVVRMG